MKSRFGRRAWLVAGALLAVLLGACKQQPSAVQPHAPETVDAEVARLIAARTADVEQEPASATAHGRLGLVYEANLMWIEARDAYTIATDLAPAEASWRLRRAVVRRNAGEPLEALDELRALAQENPGNGPVQQHLGLALLEQADVEGAAVAFGELVRIAPQAAEGYVGLGEAQRRQGDAQAAAATLEKALTLAPDYRAAHYQLGLAYRDLGRFDVAQRELALGADAITFYLPDRWAAEHRTNAVHRTMHVNRASELLKAGKTDEALAILEARLEEEPSSTKLLNKIALTLMRKGDFDGAARMLDRAVTVDAEDFRTHLSWSLWALAQRRPEEALTHADRALELGPELSEAHANRSQVLVALGREDEAADSLARAIRLDPTDSDLYQRLAGLYARLGRDDDLEALLFQALDRWPNELGAHLGLARLALERGDLEAAARSLEEARRISPRSRSLLGLERRLVSARTGRDSG